MYLVSLSVRWGPVCCGHGITDAFETYVGVKQGCFLGPYNFYLFINDLENYIDLRLIAIDVSIHCNAFQILI